MACVIALLTNWVVDQAFIFTRNLKKSPCNDTYTDESCIDALYMIGYLRHMIALI